MRIAEGKRDQRVVAAPQARWDGGIDQDGSSGVMEVGGHSDPRPSRYRCWIGLECERESEVKPDF